MKPCCSVNVSACCSISASQQLEVAGVSPKPQAEAGASGRARACLNHQPRL